MLFDRGALSDMTVMPIQLTVNLPLFLQIIIISMKCRLSVVVAVTLFL